MRTIRPWRVLAVAFSVVILFAATVGLGYAITNGQPDNGRHPYVGLIVFDAPDEEGKIVPQWRCSGTLLSPTVVLTAGHCTDGAVAARVWFADNVTASVNTEYPFGGTTSYEGIPYTYPDFAIQSEPGLVGFAKWDVGIVVLTEPVPTSVVSTYGQLPEVGEADALAGETLELVGYGVQERSVGKPPHVWTGPRIRMYAPVTLVPEQGRISDMFLKLSANPAQGKGGICFGDSGGPVLDENTVLAVNSFVTNYNCAGVTFSQRIDLAPVLDWINSFLD